MESCVRVYQDIWMPTTGECLSYHTEDNNAFDPYAVAIRKSANVIGHVPQKISAAYSLFVQKGGTLTCIANYRFPSSVFCRFTTRWFADTLNGLEMAALSKRRLNGRKAT